VNQAGAEVSMSANNRKNEPAPAAISVGLEPSASVAAQLSAMGASKEQHAALDELAERILAHVLRTIHREALYRVEQCVWSELDRLEIPDEMGDLATALLAEALFRVARSPERNLQTVPPGISPYEVIAAEYDDTCLMCREEVADMEYRLSGRCCDDLAREAKDKEWVAIQRKAAADWRAKNAAALRRFDLA
jgi:hypothetical protein